MGFEELLPIGSIVLLKNAIKKIMIIGIMQIKESEENISVYDYVGVPYPEGFVGPESGLLFHHDDIQDVVYQGYTDDERKRFINFMQEIVNHTEKTINS